MPNPLLAVSPQPEVKALGSKEPLPIGTLLVKDWGDAKTVRHKVCKVTKATKQTHGHGRFAYTTYSYEVQWLTGTVERNVGSYRYKTFDQYRSQINSRIQNTNKILNNQYQELADSEKLEKEAKLKFHIGE